MKSRCMCAVLLLFAFYSCNKKEPQAVQKTITQVIKEGPKLCDSSFIANAPVKVGETGIMLPAGTKLCLTKDKLEVNVELPDGFGFTSFNGVTTEAVGLPFATYGCYCSGVGTACNVFYADGLGFGCLQSSCVGACTGKFTYKGYSVDNIAYQSGKDDFFKLAAIQETIATMTPGKTFSKQSLYGVSFYLVKDEKAFLSKATCDCEGTAACKLKVVAIQIAKGVMTDTKIFYCEGNCNGCELTIK